MQKGKRGPCGTFRVAGGQMSTIEMNLKRMAVYSNQYLEIMMLGYSMILNSCLDRSTLILQRHSTYVIQRIFLKNPDVSKDQFKSSGWINNQSMSKWPSNFSPFRLSLFCFSFPEIVIQTTLLLKQDHVCYAHIITFGQFQSNLGEAGRQSQNYFCINRCQVNLFLWIARHAWFSMQRMAVWGITMTFKRYHQIKLWWHDHVIK